jgi:hypothetical protein
MLKYFVAETERKKNIKEARIQGIDPPPKRKNITTQKSGINFTYFNLWTTNKYITRNFNYLDTILQILTMISNWYHVKYQLPNH